MKTSSSWRYLANGLVLSALVAFGCGEDGAPMPLDHAALSLQADCSWVPGQYVSQQDGCDCPLDGNTSCDPDCSANGQGSWCGCDFCYDDNQNEVTEPPATTGGSGNQCGLVPSEYIDVDDGCDCPDDGDVSCDPDCADANPRGGACGCEYCHPGNSVPAYCDDIPSDKRSVGDGCDCLANGDTQCDSDCTAGNGAGAYCGCDTCHPAEAPADPEPDPDPPPSECSLVPAEYIDASDGCDCPADGNSFCDPDCAFGNIEIGYCGCEYCYPEDPPSGDDDPETPPPDATCADVPGEYVDAGDGCDCPASGDFACDPDCQADNAGGGYCGCEYCYPEDPPGPAPDPGTSQPEEAHTVTVELPEGSSLCELHLYAAETLTIGSGVTGAGASIGWVGANVGSNAIVQTMASDGPVTVSGGASVGIASGSSVSGSVDEFVQHHGPLAREVLSWQVLVPPGTTPNVDASTVTGTLAPGRYGTVVVPSGATLELAAGAYYFAELDVQSDGELLLPPAGSSIVHVLDALSFAGVVQGGSNAQLALIYLGTDSVTLSASIDGTLVAPYASVTLACPNTGAQAGAYFARDLTVAADTNLSRLPANLLVPHFTQDTELCSRHVCGSDPEDVRARERAVALFCLGADDVCEAEMQAAANVDYQIAAAKVVMREFTPGRYRAVSRDRSRKLRIARATPGYHCAVSSGDADGDLVPDSLDQCPNTAELTPTDDVGCPQAIPPGPDPDQVAAILDRMNISVASHCASLIAPPAPGELGAVWSLEPELTFTFNFNGGEDCPVFYELKFERRFALVTDANGVPRTDVLQFVAPLSAVTSNDSGLVHLSFLQASTEATGVSAARSFAHLDTHLYLRYRVRAITPNGRKSPWSQWSAWTFKEF